MIVVALVLSLWPHYNWFIRFLYMLMFGILAGWCEQASAAMRKEKANG